MVKRLFKLMLALLALCGAHGATAGWLGGAEAQAATQAVVFETGQTTSYAAGDDGALRPGVAWPTPRFTDNANGTVTDNLTGLIWLKNADCFGYQIWASALTLANTLASGACGLSDGSAAGQWRLPNAKELESLIDLSYADPALSAGHPFTGVQSLVGYWSSSTFAPPFTSRAWLVNMASGDVSYADKSPLNYYVWPVRAGQSGSLGSLVISKVGTGSGTVTSAPAGISCGSTCLANFTSDSSVVLTAVADSGSTFGSWSGCDSVSANQCTVTVTGSRSVTANYTATYTATASVSGGNGTITSTNTVTVNSGANASFTVSPNATYQPSATVTGDCPSGSWNGNTYTTGPIIADCTVGFSFVPVTYPVTVTLRGNGTVAGTTTGTPATLTYATSGSTSITGGAVVTLTPTAASDSIFGGWSGCDSVNGNQCTVTMDGARNVTATFNALATVRIDGTATPYFTIGSTLDLISIGSKLVIARDSSFAENVIMTSPATILFKGGYTDADFTTRGTSSYTIINGSLKVRNGTLRVDRLKVR